jgi:hypothetical protein
MWTFTGYEKMAEQPHQWHLDGRVTAPRKKLPPITAAEW